MKYTATENSLDSRGQIDFICCSRILNIQDKRNWFLKKKKGKMPNPAC